MRAHIHAQAARTVNIFFYKKIKCFMVKIRGKPPPLQEKNNTIVARYASTLRIAGHGREKHRGKTILRTFYDVSPPTLR